MFDVGGGGLLARERPPPYEAAGGAAPARPASDLASALTDLDEAVDRLDQIDIDDEDAGALGTAIVRIHQLQSRLAAQQLRVVERADAREAYRVDGAVTCASWLRGRTRMDHREAAATASAARRLRRLPRLRALLRTGAVSSAHVTAITSAMVPRRAAAIAAVEHTLAGLARAATPSDVRRAVRHVADIVDPDGTELAPLVAEGPDERRWFSLSRGLDGLWQAAGALDPLAGEALMTLLDAYETFDPPGTPADRRRSRGQRQADALDAVARRLLDAGDTPVVQGNKPHILAVMDVATLAGADSAAARPPRLRFGGELDPADARRLARHAKVTAVQTMGPWRPVSVGRTQRTLPAWLRPVLEAVHGHCRGLDCDRPIAWTQAHHEEAWAAGGATDLARTIPLCQAHHSMVTSGRWRVGMDADTGVCTWTSSTGRTRRTHPPPAPP